MITPLEIENKEFSKAVRGYKAEEVDEFLDGDHIGHAGPAG